MWAGSIGNMAVNLTKENSNSRENNPEVLSRTVLKGLNVYLMHKYKEQKCDFCDRYGVNGVTDRYKMVHQIQYTINLP